VQRRRRALGAAVAAIAVVGVAAAVGVLGSGPDRLISDPPIAGSPMDLSHGLRAYADPGGQLRMGGRTFPAEDLAALDTDAAATSYGVVYFRGGQPFLLGEDGTSRPLWDSDADAGFHPTAKSDPAAAVVAFAVRSGSEVTLVVRDLTEAATVSLPLDCDADPGCDHLVVDGVDSGTVFVRTSEGTYRWDYTASEKLGLQPFAGPRTRVADVRNQTVLYDGPRPTVTLEGWTYVAGAIDAQLTFDGSNVLYWSPELKSVKPGGDSVRLDLPGDAQFFTVDTDGSVLAATTGDPAVFYDCDLPSGACEEIGRLQMTGGDPMFIGNDM
jgi:hypothetical protein